MPRVHTQEKGVAMQEVIKVVGGTLSACVAVLALVVAVLNPPGPSSAEAMPTEKDDVVIDEAAEVKLKPVAKVIVQPKPRPKRVALNTEKLTAKLLNDVSQYLRRKTRTGYNHIELDIRSTGKDVSSAVFTVRYRSQPSSYAAIESDTSAVAVTAYSLLQSYGLKDDATFIQCYAQSYSAKDDFGTNKTTLYGVSTCSWPGKLEFETANEMMSNSWLY